MKVDFPSDAGPARRVARRLQEAGASAFLIGGCVRDLCLKTQPKDYDVATSFSPDEVIAVFPGANETGKSFGVVRVRLGGDEIEVATFRRDGPYSDGRRPDFVEFTSLEEDIHRRDFTINALAADPETGEVIDHVRGLADLQDGVIRCVGDPSQRFHEDRLRLIRAVRFAHRLGFRVEPATWAALQAMAGQIRDVAMERVSDEFTKIICHAPCGRGLRMMDECGMLEALLPEVTRMKGVEQPEQFHPEGDVFVHTLMTMDELDPEPTAAAAWAALLHDVGKPDTFSVSDRIRFHGHAELGAKMARRIMRRFRLSNAVIDRAAEIIAEHMKFASIPKMRPGKVRRWAAMEHFEELMEVHRADCAGSHRDMTAHEAAMRYLEEVRRLEAMPAKIVTGDLLVRMGLEPGPSFRTIIDDAYEAQLEGRIVDEAGAIEHVRFFLARDGRAD